MVALTWSRPGVYYGLVREDSALEWLQFGSVQSRLNLGLALASLYGLLAPSLVRWRVLVVPPLALAGAFFAMLAHTCARAAFFPHPSHALAKFSEWPETCFAGALALFALLAWRKAGPEK